MKRLESFQNSRTRRRKAMRILRAVIIAFLCFEAFTALIAKTWSAGSSSMAPTIVRGDRLIVSLAAYGLPVPFSGRRFAFVEPERGDMVLLREPSAERLAFFPGLADAVLRFVTAQRISLDRETPVIKRVVAVPGDVVKMENFIVYVRASDTTHFLTEYELSGKAYDLHGKGLPEGWTNAPTGGSLPLSGSFPETFLSDGEYFVVGDDRTASTDSRFFGAVGPGQILGKVVLRYWPFNRLARF